MLSDMVMHLFNPIIQKAEGNGSLRVQVHSNIYSKFQDSQGYRVSKNPTKINNSYN